MGLFYQTKSNILLMVSDCIYYSGDFECILKKNNVLYVNRSGPNVKVLLASEADADTYI